MRNESHIAKTADTPRYMAVYFTLFAVCGAVNPYLQLLLRGLGYGPAAVGLFQALFEVVGILGPLVIARAADRAGKRKPALLLSAAAILASLPGLALGASPWVTGLCVALLAVGMKTMVPVMDAGTVAHLAALPAPAGGKGKASYGGIRVMGSVGFIVAAMALQFVPGSNKGDPTTLVAAFAAAAVVFAASLALLPEGRRSTVPAPQAAPSPAAPGARAPGAAKGLDPVFILGLVIIALNRFALTPVTSFISLYATDGLHLTNVGWLWAIAACSEIPLMLASGPIIRKVGSMGAVALSGVGLVLRLGTLALFPSEGGLIAAQLLHSLCFGLFQPGAVAFVAERVPAEKRSLGMAIFTGFGAGLPTVLANALGGFIVEAAGYRLMFASFIAVAAASIVLYLATRKSFRRA
jgi:PPP family 3-phenylpropionic acid transporter